MPDIPPQAQRWSCLDESEPYAQINKRTKFFQKYYRALALIPFAVVMFVILRLFGDPPIGGPRNKFILLPVFIVLGWAGFVPFYALSLMVRRRRIRCPSCGNRFGSDDQCISCGFPRHSPTPKPPSMFGQV